MHVGEVLRVEHQAAELERGALELVAGCHRGADRVRLLRHGDETRWWRLPDTVPWVRRLHMMASVIFKRVGEGRPYPAHELAPRDWAALPPRTVRLDELVTTKDTLQLAALLDEDSTFFGDLFAHVVEWQGDLYLEDGLHRALRAALQQRNVLHARVHVVAG